MTEILKKPIAIFKTLLDLVLPPVCYICQRSCSGKYGLCETCLEKIKREKRLKDNAFIHSDSSKNSYVERAWSCCYYKDTIRECIHLFKYKGYVGLIDIFRDIMVDFIQKYDINKNIDLIVPIPIYPTKKRERTYNHSEILAASVSKCFAIPMDVKNLKKIKWTTSQSELDRKKRLKNVVGTLLTVNKEVFTGKHVLLIDDVYTTGATINECAKILKGAGAGRVFSLTLAR